jgi:hypothetical protein
LFKRYSELEQLYLHLKMKGGNVLWTQIEWGRIPSPFPPKKLTIFDLSLDAGTRSERAHSFNNFFRIMLESKVITPQVFVEDLTINQFFEVHSNTQTVQTKSSVTPTGLFGALFGNNSPGAASMMPGSGVGVASGGGSFSGLRGAIHNLADNLMEQASVAAQAQPPIFIDERGCFEVKFDDLSGTFPLVYVPSLQAYGITEARFFELVAAFNATTQPYNQLAFQRASRQQVMATSNLLSNIGQSIQRGQQFAALSEHAWQHASTELQASTAAESALDRGPIWRTEKRSHQHTSWDAQSRMHKTSTVVTRYLVIFVPGFSSYNNLRAAMEAKQNPYFQADPVNSGPFQPGHTALPQAPDISPSAPPAYEEIYSGVDKG